MSAGRSGRAFLPSPAACATHDERPRVARLLEESESAGNRARALPGCRRIRRSTSRARTCRSAGVAKAARSPPSPRAQLRLRSSGSVVQAVDRMIGDLTNRLAASAREKEDTYIGFSYDDGCSPGQLPLTNISRASQRRRPGCTRSTGTHPRPLARASSRRNPLWPYRSTVAPEPAHAFVSEPRPPSSRSEGSTMSPVGQIQPVRRIMNLMIRVMRSQRRIIGPNDTSHESSATYHESSATYPRPNDAPPRIGAIGSSDRMRRLMKA